MAALSRSWQRLATWFCVSCAVCSGCAGGQTGTPTSSCSTPKADLERAERELEAFEGRYAGTATWEATAEAGAPQETTTALQVELMLVDGTAFQCTSPPVIASVNISLRSDDGKLDVTLTASVTREADGSTHVDWDTGSRAPPATAHSGQLVLSADFGNALEAKVGEATLRAPVLVKEDK